MVNVYQPYIAHYNNGNRLYKLGDHKEAINEYKRALELFPPEKKECSIRINLALAMINNIENESEPNVEDILDVLAEAKEVLCEGGCANRDNNKGHSKKAEQLKEDIEEYEEKLKKQQKESKDDKENKKDKDKDDSQDDDNNKDDELKRKEKQIKELQKQSNKSRQQDVGSVKDSNSYEYYSGKKW
ncbi:MAG: tetratricopeptide repeat protein [Clostridia bacterium]|nr:tetratricopeptide repeat protein [Clostridia bacterium]